jgi:hypothetical protein
MKTPDRQDRLMTLFAQLTQAVMQTGMAHARRDDPHAFNRAAQWLAAGGGRFQLRVDVELDGEIAVHGLIADTDGEAVCEVFTLTAQPTPTNQ